MHLYVVEIYFHFGIWTFAYLIPPPGKWLPRRGCHLLFAACLACTCNTICVHGGSPTPPCVCFMDEPNRVFGQILAQQVEDRLVHLETGKEVETNEQVMEKAMVAYAALAPHHTQIHPSRLFIQQ